jgi:hypothetical protein
MTCERASLQHTTAFTIRVNTNDDKAYAIFPDEDALIAFHKAFPPLFDGCYIVCYGGYYNAFELGSLH